MPGDHVVKVIRDVERFNDIGGGWLMCYRIMIDDEYGTKHTKQ
jgi:hypothetical protein